MAAGDCKSLQTKNPTSSENIACRCCIDLMQLAFAVSSANVGILAGVYLHGEESLDNHNVQYPDLDLEVFRSSMQLIGS